MRPLPPSELPEGVTCALTAGPLTDEDRRQVARFQRYLADRKAVQGRYAPRLKALSARDPQYAEVWNRRAAELTALREAYDAEQPEGEPTC
jgi:hypothetical protein